MPAQTVTDVSTAGVVIPYATSDTRLYWIAWAGTLSSGEEVPLTNGNAAVQSSVQNATLDTHQSGQLSLVTGKSYTHTFGMAAGSVDAKATEILTAAGSSTNAAHEKDGKYTVILADGSAQRGLNTIGDANPNGETSAVFNYTVAASVLTYTHALATA